MSTINEFIKTKLHYTEVADISNVVDSYLNRYKDDLDPEYALKLTQLVDRLGKEVYSYPRSDFTDKLHKIPESSPNQYKDYRIEQGGIWYRTVEITTIPYCGGVISRWYRNIEDIPKDVKKYHSFDYDKIFHAK